MELSETDVTALLSEMAAGNEAAADRLFPIVYGELKRLARSYMRREGLITLFRPLRWCMRPI
jgi:hypothetical protein